MMKSLRVLLVLLIVLPRGRPTTIPAQEDRQQSGKKREAPLSSYSDKLKECLFKYWKDYSISSSEAAIDNKIRCAASEGNVPLCYSVPVNGKFPNPAQFVSCYNTKSLIPIFTANVVNPGIVAGGDRDDWRKDGGTFPQADPAEDYDKYKQKPPQQPQPQQGIVENFSPNNQFCARGHLTPNADFSVADERGLTMISTNIAPQWQPFNGGNWAKLEESVRRYASTSNHKLYVFTGTGGQAVDSRGNPILLNKRVQAPKYYWKAVCDPIAKQSIIFVALNNIGDVSTEKVRGCNGKEQTSTSGVVYCYALDKVQAANKDYKSFALPPFHQTNCVPSVKGTFMDANLNLI